VGCDCMAYLVAIIHWIYFFGTVKYQFF